MQFASNFVSTLLAFLVAKAIGVIIVIAVLIVAVKIIAAAEPGDFMYVTDLEVDNIGSADPALRMVRVPVNLSNYVSSNLLTAVCNDRVFEHANGLATTSGFTQDCNVNAAGVWVWATSTPSTVETPKMYHGGDDADDGFTLVGGNNDGSGLAAGGHSPLRATSTAAIEISDLLDIRVDISAEIPCGTMVYKVGTQIQDGVIGYGLWVLGKISSASVTTGGGSGGNSAIYLEITALESDMWLCTVGSFSAFTDWTQTTAHSVEVIEIGGPRLCLSDDFIPVEYPEYISMSASNVMAAMFNSPCLIKQDTPVRIIINGLDMGDSTTVINATSTDGLIHFDTTGADVGGASPWRSGAGQPIHITAIEDRFVAGGISRTGTSTQTRILSMVDDDWDTPASTVTWDGERTTWQIDYNDPDFDILKNGIVVDTIPEAGGIATSSFDLEIGRGFYRGTLYNFEMDAGATTVMDFDFDGNDIFEQTQGNSANAFQWTGLINNEGTATTTPLEYILTWDDTNINTSVSGFTDNPIATPVGGVVSTSTSLVGNPSLNPLFTPFPTTSGGMIVGPIIGAANASSLPPQTWVMLVATVFFAVILAFINKFFPNRVIFAALAVVLFAVVSLSVGNILNMWIVGLFGMWAFGSTGLLMMGNR